MIRSFIQLLIFLSAWGTFVQAKVKVSVLKFSNLPGWKSNTKTDVLTAFMETCPDLKSDDWAAICAIGQQTTDADVLFVGSGSQAGKDAGRIKNSGSLYVLLPIKRALALSRG